MSYGPNIPDLFRRAADYVDKNFKGRKTGRFTRGTAHQVRSHHQLGLTVPQMLTTADELIE